MAVACCNVDELCATIHNVCSVESLRSKLACTDSCNALGFFCRLITDSMKGSRHGAGLLRPAPTVPYVMNNWDSLFWVLQVQRRRVGLAAFAPATARQGCRAVWDFDDLQKLCSAA